MLQDTSFHPCVRLARWTTSKILSFVPPDGAFELMGYRLDSSSQQGSIGRRTATWMSSASSANLPVPLRVRPVITVGEIGGSFNITVSPPTTFTAGGATKLEDVVVSLKLGENATGLKGSISSPASSASRIQSSTARGPGDKLPAGGTWEFDTTSHTLIWRIPKLQANSPTLSGTWLFDESKKSGSRPSSTLDVTFKAPLSNISGLSITNLKVEGERYSMYKALRSHLTGSLEVRW
jgi:AP-3 complex subunit mu